MDMAFDLEGTSTSAPTRRATGANAPPVGHPSWPDLLARFIAAREASVSMARQNRVEIALEHGSFHGDAAAFVVAQGTMRRSVNPNDLGNSKSDGAIAPSVAGLTRTGGRG